jgi:hypothetical protein
MVEISRELLSQPKDGNFKRTPNPSNEVLKRIPPLISHLLSQPKDGLRVGLHQNLAGEIEG